MIDIHTLDLEFQGHRELIAAFLVPCPDGGFILIETGPGSTLETLEAEINRAGFDLLDLQGLFPTHIHLDHAAGVGELAVHTGAAVFAHHSAIPHLLDPAEKLLPSARRLYGDRMDSLWGSVDPVPKELLVEIRDGDTVELNGLDVVAHTTPGHAVHHVAWQVGNAVATGDVAGIRFPGSRYVLPPMPPPDIDVALWRTSIERIRMIEPEMLLLTHFGPVDDVEDHLASLEGRIDLWLTKAEENLDAGGDASDLARIIGALTESEMAEAAVPPAALERYRHLCPPDGNTAGLDRYCRLRRE